LYNKDQELIGEYYIERNPEKKMSGNEFEIKLRNEMKQAVIAKKCAQWLEIIRGKVQKRGLGF